MTEVLGYGPALFATCMYNENHASQREEQPAVKSRAGFERERRIRSPGSSSSQQFTALSKAIYSLYGRCRIWEMGVVLLEVLSRLT